MTTNFKSLSIWPIDPTTLHCYVCPPCLQKTIPHLLLPPEVPSALFTLTFSSPSSMEKTEAILEELLLLSPASSTELHMNSSSLPSLLVPKESLCSHQRPLLCLAWDPIHSDSPGPCSCKCSLSLSPSLPFITFFSTGSFPSMHFRVSYLFRFHNSPWTPHPLCPSFLLSSQ